MAEAIAEILKQGLLGAFCVIAGIVIYRLSMAKDAAAAACEAKFRADSEAHAAKLVELSNAHAAEVRELHNIQTTDAKAYAAQLLKMLQDTVTGMNTIANANGALKESFDDLKETVKATQPRR